MGLTLDLDLKKCTSCGACAIACMDQNDIDVERGIRPFRTVFDWESREPGCQKFIHISIACMHCPDAPCVAACPFGIPSFNEEGKMQKCDGCAVRIQNGLEPACVRACPVGALRLVSSEEIEGKDKENSLQKLGREVLEFQT